jgi:DNA primase
LVELTKPLLDKIPAGVFHDMMIGRLEALAQHQISRPGTATPARAKRPAVAGKPLQQRTPMRMALAHLVQNPALAVNAGKLDAFEGCDLAGFEIYRELVDFCTKSPNMTTAQLLELWRDHPAQSHLNTLATWSLPGQEAKLVQEFTDAVTGLELQWTEAQISRMPRIVDLELEDRKKLLALQQRRQQLIIALQGEPQE